MSCATLGTAVLAATEGLPSQGRQAGKSESSPDMTAAALIGGLGLLFLLGFLGVCYWLYGAIRDCSPVFVVDDTGIYHRVEGGMSQIPWALIQRIEGYNVSINGKKSSQEVLNVTITSEQTKSIIAIELSGLNWEHHQILGYVSRKYCEVLQNQGYAVSLKK